ncbi:MAG: protoporphyrinogen oxidase HemJ [Candidatus Endonucleobacter bathymodioli]|uniref:Protoporphyrinogen IX oxidase n=1 Tax=Candidatus Endonucleibacter bathymodioli TaxID=539814 RepID=A0AA90SU78_9GAMM|nr:protoporphyrinogen oxidase HemJ [Candidatus Endonucleobacter bathymodioli]
MLWIKALHLIALVCWFAALFYLPRLFVYHALTSDDSGSARFKVMERNLYRMIATPAMLATVLFGGWLLSYNVAGYMAGGWMHAKLALVAVLLGYHHLCGRYLKAFAEDKNRKSQTFFRWFNEVPVILLVGIIILVVVKPF